MTYQFHTQIPLTLAVTGTMECCTFCAVKAQKVRLGIVSELTTLVSRGYIHIVFQLYFRWMAISVFR